LSIKQKDVKICR